MNRSFALGLCLYGLLLWSLAGCSRAPRTGPMLSDRKLASLLLDAVRLQRKYANHPDSLILKRKDLFRRYGVTRADLDSLISRKERHPGAWKGVLKTLARQVRQEQQTFEAHPSARKKALENRIKPPPARVPDTTSRKLPAAKP